jgi:hypothetical protein
MAWTCGFALVVGSAMIVVMTLRLLYLSLCQLPSRLALLARKQASKNARAAGAATRDRGAAGDAGHDLGGAQGELAAGADEPAPDVSGVAVAVRG